MPINDTTPNLGLPLPHVDNLLADDVQRIRTAFGAVDGAFAAKADLVGGFVPASQLPGFVDDVLEYPSMAAFPATGETGKLYIAIDTSKVYRWGGSIYAEIASSPGSTDAVPEGAANLYFTAARARAAQVPATPSTLGVVKVGSGLMIDADGILSAVGGGAGSGVPVYGDIVLTPSSNGQTVFTVSGGYAPGQLDVFLNGVFLAGNGDDFTATNGTTFTLTVGASAGDTLIARRWIYLPEAQAVNKNGDTMAGALNFAPLTSVASAATVSLSLTSSNHVTITGTTTITSFGASASGLQRVVVFAGALVITHNATSLILPSGTNITTAAGDVAEFVSLGSGNWRCTGYTRANGQALVVSPDTNKLDKTGGVASKLSFTYLDQGTIAASGTVNISAVAATTHRIQAGGALTITFSDLVVGAFSSELELHCVNFGGKTITWPAGNWIKPDGSYVAAVGNSGVTWQTAGTDRVLVMIDNGAVFYKVMR